MTDIATVTLSAAVLAGQAITFPYPSGTSADDFVGGTDHQIASHNGGTLFGANGDFTLSFGISSITATLGANKNLPLGAQIWLHLARPKPAGMAVLSLVADVAGYTRPTGVVMIDVMGDTARFDGGGGRYAFDPFDTSSAASPPSILVGADGGRWKRIDSGSAEASPHTHALTRTTKAASYAVTNGDLAGNQVHYADNAAAVTVTVMAGLTGTEPLIVIQQGAGQVTLVAGVGVALRSADGALKTRVQYASLALIPSGTADIYDVVGDLAA